MFLPIALFIKMEKYLESRQAGHHENVVNFIPKPSGGKEMNKTKVGTVFFKHPVHFTYRSLRSVKFGLD